MKFGSITTPIVTDGLLFNMDAANMASYPETGTTVTDTVGNIAGTMTSAEMFISSNANVVANFNFDGSDDSINFGDILDAPTSFSIFSWINVFDDSEFPIVVKGIGALNIREYALYVFGGKVQGSIADESAGDVDHLQGSTTITEVEWINVGTTWDGSTLRVYLNGVIDGSVSTSVTEIENLSTPLYIGQDASPDFARGRISNTQIYNRALSATEILHNYNALKGRFGLS